MFELLPSALVLCASIHLTTCSVQALLDAVHKHQLPPFNEVMYCQGADPETGKMESGEITHCPDPVFFKECKQIATTKGEFFRGMMDGSRIYACLTVKGTS